MDEQTDVPRPRFEGAAGDYNVTVDGVHIGRVRYEWMHYTSKRAKRWYGYSPWNWQLNEAGPNGERTSPKRTRDEAASALLRRARHVGVVRVVRDDTGGQGGGGAMSDEMAEAHRRDSENERAFRDCARQIDALLTEPRYQGRMSARTLTALTEARDALREDADHIVRAWD